MADTIAPPPIPITTLSLRDFLSLAAADLNATSESRHTIEEIVSAAQYYPQIAERVNALGLPIFDNPEEAAVMLRGELERVAQTLPDQVLNEGAQTPTSPEAPEEIATRARLLHVETEKVRTTRSRDERLKELRGSYVSRVMENYLKQSGLSAEQARELAAQVKSQTNTNLSTDAQIREAADRITTVQLTPEQKQRYVQEAKVRAAAETPLMDRELRREAALATTWKTLAANPGARPDVTFAIAENIAIENPSMGSRDVAAAAISHTAMLSAVSGAKTPTNYAAVSSSLYSAYAPGLRGAVGDFLSTIMPKDLRGYIAEYRIVKSIERVGNAIQASGEQFASSPAFNELWEQAKKYEQPQQLKGAGAIAAQASDLAGYVFGSPNTTVRLVYENGKVTQELIPAPQEVRLINVHHAAQAGHMAPFHAAEMGHGISALGGLFRFLKNQVVGKFLGGLLGGLIGGPAGALAGGGGGGLLGMFGAFLKGKLFDVIQGKGKKYDWMKDGYTPVLLASFAVVILMFTALFVPTCSICARRQHLANAWLTGWLAAGGGEVTGNFPQPNYEAVQEAGVCINYTPKSTTTSLPGTTPGAQPTDAFLSAVNSSLGKGLGLFACALNCPARKITFNQLGFASSEGYWGWAPSGSIGTVQLYNQFYAGTERARVRLIAHELMHQIQYFNPDVFDAYFYGSTDQPKGYCGQLGTYEWNETSGETFAEAGAMYIIGDPFLQQKCPAGYAFMNSLFSSCGSAVGAGSELTPTGACTPGPATKSFATIGDSIATPNGFPTALTGLLANEGLDAQLVGSVSKGGMAPQNMVAEAGTLARDKKPDYILIHAGTNQVNSTPEENVQGIKAMITAIRTASPGTTIVLAQIIQRYDNNGAYMEDVSVFNKAIAAFAGPNVIVVNMENAVSRNEAPDTIHPNADGYENMARLWLGAMRGGLSQCEK